MKSSARMLVIFTLAIFGWQSIALADGEGQAEYDKAIALKVKAKTTKDFDEVVALCEKAIEKGLDKDTKKLAQQMIKNTLSDLCTKLSDEVFKMAQSGQGTWRFKRRQAIVRIEKYLDKNKDDGAVFFRLARLQLLPGGDRGKAREALDKAVKSDALTGEDATSALMLTGMLAENDEEREKAFEAAIKKDPKNVKNLRMRAQYYYGKNLFEKAEGDFRKLSEIKKDDVSFKRALVETLLRQSKESKLKEAVKVLSQLIDADDGNIELYIERARVHGRLRDSKNEIADLTKVLEKDDRNILALLMRGWAYLSDDKVDAAKKDLKAIQEINKYNLQGVLLEAQIAAHEKDYDLAVKNLKTVIRVPALSPDQKNAYRLQLALYLRSDEKFNDALQVYEEILESDTDNVGAIVARADTVLGMGEHEQAIADYETSMDLELDNRQKEHVWNNLAWMLATSPVEKLRDGKRAIELAKKACELTEYKEAYILSTLASGYAEAGNFDEAIKWSTKAVELAKKNPTRDDQVEDLQKELDSYKKKKPWRELQKDEDKSGKKKEKKDDDFDF